MNLLNRRKHRYYRVSDYCERQDAYMFTKRRKHKFVCLSCFNPSVTEETCSVCGSSSVKSVNVFARIPKKHSNKTKWKEFFTIFFRELDFEFRWKSRKRS